LRISSPGLVEVGRYAQRIDLEAEQFVDRFAAGKPFGHQRLGQAAILRGGERDQARVLAQAGAEHTGRGGERAAHQAATATSSSFRSCMPDGT
jgi:hypothetical protein